MQFIILTEQRRKHLIIPTDAEKALEKTEPPLRILAAPSAHSKQKNTPQPGRRICENPRASAPAVTRGSHPGTGRHGTLRDSTHLGSGGLDKAREETEHTDWKEEVTLGFMQNKP